MKNFQNLTKDELISLLYNNFNFSVIEENLECAGCGLTPDAKYYYICDRCNEIKE